MVPYRGAFALPMIMSLFACCRPVSQVMKLWDAMLAGGLHLNVLLCVAQILLLRDALLEARHPLQHLSPRRLPPLDAQLLVRAALEVQGCLPERLKREIAEHVVAVPKATAEHRNHRRPIHGPSMGHDLAQRSGKKGNAE